MFYIRAPSYVSPCISLFGLGAFADDLEDFSVSTFLPLNTGQICASVFELGIINPDFDLLKGRHLYHVLNGRSNDDHLEAFPFAAFGHGGGGGTQCFFWLWYSEELVLSSGFHGVDRIGL